LQVFKDKTKEKAVRKIYNTLKKSDCSKEINNWKKYKPICVKIEDFFKICKYGLSLKKLHKYTLESAKKTTIITVFLAGLITTTGYTIKTDLQKLSKPKKSKTL